MQVQAAHQSGSMAAWELQKVWLAQDGQVWGTPALPPPFHMNYDPDRETASLTEACLKGLGSELLLLGLL